MWTSCQSDETVPITDDLVVVQADQLSSRSVATDPCDDVGDCTSESWTVTQDPTVVLPDFPGCTFVVEYRERECNDGYDFQIMGFGVIGSCPQWLDSLSIYQSQGDAPLANFMLRMQRRIAEYYALSIAAAYPGPISPFPTPTFIGALVLGDCLSYCLTGLDPVQELGPEPHTSSIPAYVDIIHCGELCCEIPISASIRDGDLYVVVAVPSKVASDDTCELPPVPSIGNTCASDRVKGYQTRCLQHCTAI